ncbi:alpha/beta hydrolase [Streptomyces sp. NBC_00237]|uniref:alpha/beta fold hydrolase n=1 Tax=Streptomyces sp. NBC_00237 TaxID=2975687 RepID=UPI00224E2FEF|nr:alpha/beta hydrolase [Streptomyces sp. NBC_00237]MCX5201517.1 alpha/beta hydrolase [Streptomyces sp. NBC_00237]
MREAVVTSGGDRMRWVELPGEEPCRVYVHGLGGVSGMFVEAAAHPALAGRRSLLVDLLGFGVSDRPDDFAYGLDDHAEALAALLREAGAAGAEVVGHSMGGAVALVLAERCPELVSKLVLVHANLDAITPAKGAPGSGGIAGYGSEEEFVSTGWGEEVRASAGETWWSTMKTAGARAVYRSAVGLTRGSEPVMRELLLGLKIPRAYVLPEGDAEFRGGEELVAAGVRVVAVPDCGHNVMTDNVDGFARAAAAVLEGEDG